MCSLVQMPETGVRFARAERQLLRKTRHVQSGAPDPESKIYRRKDRSDADSAKAESSETIVCSRIRAGNTIDPGSPERTLQRSRRIPTPSDVRILRFCFPGKVYDNSDAGGHSGILDESLACLML